MSDFGFNTVISQLDVPGQGEEDRGPLLGFGDEETFDVPVDPRGEAARLRPGITRPVTTTPGIFEEDARQAVFALDPDSRKSLALEIFFNVDGAYRDVDDLFNEDGDLIDDRFSEALGRTFTLAGTFGPEGFGSGTDENSEFLQILMGDRSQTTPELMARFEELKAKISAAKGGGGGGRAINFIDPVALAAAAKQGFSGVTGRKANIAEQQAFVKTIHGLQSSGATGIQVGARADAFARDSAPAEAGAMDISNAAGMVMQAMGLG